ncbi:MAG: hypothetical protein IJ211_08295 [Campylobacter sp.]|nr:hypothetical protein [Campylobacter sp.]
MNIKDLIKRILPNFIVEFIRHLNTIKMIKKTHKNYENLILNLQKEVKNRPIRFASYVVFDSTFGAKKLYELMKNDDKFDAKIVIVPDTARGEENLKKCYNATKEFFIKNYGKEMVLDGWDEKTGEFLDHSDKFDIIYFANPYDEMVHEYHKICYIAKKNILPIYINYAFSHFKYGEQYIFSIPEMSLCWQVYMNNKFEFDKFTKLALSKGLNAKIVGYAKMDSFKIKKKEKDGKKIILIAPHHTIKNNVLQISNFLYYYDFILTLPQKFPNVRFIFRPHPLLFTNLLNQGFWSKEQVSEYLEKIKNVMEFSSGGDYLDIFNEADGIIHDCGSFISEWLYSGKKGCFVSYDGLVFDQLTEYGKIALSHYFIAKNETGIISYINDVIDDKTKPLDMEKIKDEIMLNYPNVSQKILDEIKQTLGVK